MGKQRRKDGTFKKGHKGVGGRPKRSNPEVYQKAFSTAVSVKDWIKIIKKAAEDAVGPNHTARHQGRMFLASYLIGPPVQKIAPTDPTGENPYMTMTDSQLLALAHNIVDTEQRKAKDN